MGEETEYTYRIISEFGLRKQTKHVFGVLN
jgi:hypothetical protein